jgi:hypothetical protein
MLGFALVWLAEVPFGLAAVWWERRHHVSHQGYLASLIGSFLALGSRFVFIALALAIAMGLAGVLRRWWWVVATPLFAALALLSSFLSPYLIPNTHPLRDPAIAADARALAATEGVPGTRVLVQKVSRSITAPNAEAAGIGPTRRVVLWDTLLDGRFGTSVRTHGGCQWQRYEHAANHMLCMRWEPKVAVLQGVCAMRMRGLEPPPGCPDTDLNRSRPENMGPPTSGTSHFPGFHGRRRRTWRRDCCQTVATARPSRVLGGGPGGRSFKSCLPDLRKYLQLAGFSKILSRPRVATGIKRGSNFRRSARRTGGPGRVAGSARTRGQLMRQSCLARRSSVGCDDWAMCRATLRRR